MISLSCCSCCYCTFSTSISRPYLCSYLCSIFHKLIFYSNCSCWWINCQSNIRRTCSYRPSTTIFSSCISYWLWISSFLWSKFPSNNFSSIFISISYNYITFIIRCYCWHIWFHKENNCFFFVSTSIKISCSSAFWVTIVSYTSIILWEVYNCFYSVLSYCVIT